MNRRDFLRLLMASLAGAGVTQSTIGRAFAGLARADKMSVGKAIERLAKRYEEAKTGVERTEIATAALLVMSEAHRDFTLAWAGGAVTYWCSLLSHLPRCGGITSIARAARDNRRDPSIGPFLTALRDHLLGGDVAKSTLLIHESYMAWCKMSGRPVTTAHKKMTAHSLGVLLEHHPEIYRADYGQLPPWPQGSYA